VIRAFDGHGAVDGRRAAGTLNEFLQAALGIARGQARGAQCDVAHDARGDRSRSVEASVEEDSRNQGFDDVGEHLALRGVSGRAAAEAHETGELDAAGEGGERFGVHQGGAHAGEPAFGRVGNVQQQQLAHAQAEHGVTEELEAFVVARARVLVDVGGMGEGVLQLGGLAFKTEGFEQLCNGGRHGDEPAAGAGKASWIRHAAGASMLEQGVKGPYGVAVVRYADRRVADLVACPFCREMFKSGEVEVCPACGLAVADVAKLPPSYEAQLEPDFPREPEHETLPWGYWRGGRAALVAAAIAGMALFFAPWIVETAPEIETLSGVDLAERLRWMWACPVAWFVLIPAVLSRRTLDKMRGARVIVSAFCAIPMVSAAVMLMGSPRPKYRIPMLFHYGWGLYATLVLAVVALPFAIAFGGRLAAAKPERDHRH
jgi:hypothetical protein